MLHDVVRHSNKDRILAALDACVHEINDADHLNKSPLMVLVSRRFHQLESAVEMVDAFVDRGAKIDLFFADGRTALYYAVEVQSMHAVTALLRHNPRLDFLVDRSYSLLQKSILLGGVDVFMALFAHSPEEVLAMRDEITGETFLHYLVDYRHTFKEVLAQVISTPKCESVFAMCDNENETPLLKAAMQRRRSRALIVLLYSKCERLTPIHSVRGYVYKKRLMEAQAIIKQ